ncbi:MAG: aromatic ring-hydroxylating dioxygenase subunit alpha [Proteobacteria bacterium]|nr:aromatic ring-hydroxylating dioxygenase subunit alpha [Pseudomonadota bacterium]MBI3496724.1 aromatic ring-hydroxylating dioxygenase subunit alpha [Pseudomonadota bacterium]
MADPVAAERSELLRDVWYFALPGRDLKPGTMRAKTLLGEPLLLGRDQAGAAFALLDVCPHRGMPLSFGRFDGREIECCYHGWRFQPSGRCTAIPSLVEGQAFDASRIKVRSYPAREVQGNIWVFFGADPSGAPDIPVVPDIGERAADLAEAMNFPCAMDHAVVGLMDPAHGPFVHRAWWWRSAASIHEKAKAFQPSPWGFTMLRHAPSTNSRAYRLIGGKPETEISFRLPGVRVEHIRTDKLVVGALTSVTPTEPGMTEINHAIWWTARWLDFVKPMARPYVRAFLRQDRDIMARQAIGLKHVPALMLIDDADTQAKWYYRLKKEYAASRSEGRTFVNPVKPRTLRWRS